MKMKIKGRIREMVTIGQLAKMCGDRSAVTLRKLEEAGILPVANWRTTPGKTGVRVYTKELAESVAEVFIKEIRQGAKVSEPTKQKLKDLFLKERIETGLN